MGPSRPGVDDEYAVLALQDLNAADAEYADNTGKTKSRGLRTNAEGADKAGNAAKSENTPSSLFTAFSALAAFRSSPLSALSM